MLDRLFTENELREGWLCKAISRHTFDGHTYEEVIRRTNTVRWMERFKCVFCLTERITPKEPGSALIIGGRQYHYADDYDRDLTNAEAARLLTRRMMKVHHGSKRA